MVANKNPKTEQKEHAGNETTESKEAQANILDESKKHIEEIYEVKEQEEVEQVVTTIGGAVEVTKLGVEVSEKQKEAVSYWIDLLAKDKEISVSQIEMSDNVEKKQALKIVYNAIAVDLIGSYWDASRREINPDWKEKGFDIMKISENTKPLVADPHKLDVKALSSDALLLVSFLQTESPLTNEIRQDIYPKLVKIQEKEMTELFTTYNKFLRKPAEDQEKEKNIFQKALTGVENDRKKLGDKEVDAKDKLAVGLKYAGIAVGGWMAVRAIRRGWNKLFGSKEEKQEGDKKEKKSSRWKRLLGIGGGAFVLRLLTKRDNDDTQNPDGDFEGGNPGTVPNKSEVVDYLETIDPAQQALAARAVSGINAMFEHQKVGTDTFGASSFEETKEGEIAPGLLIAVLQDRHGNVNELLTTGTYYQELLGSDVNAIWQGMRKLSMKAIQSLGIALLKPLGDNMVTQFLKEKTVDKMVDHLQAQDMKVDRIYQVLRKNLSIISYVQLKKEQLEEKLASDYLAKNDKNRSTYDDEKKQEKIEDFLEDATFYQEHIEPVVVKRSTLPLMDLKGNGETFLGVLDAEGILDESLPAETQERLGNLAEEFVAMYECEEFDGHSIFEIDPFENGKLSEDGKASIEKVIDNIQEHMGETGKAGFLSSYLPLLTLFTTGQNTEQEILGAYAPLVEQYTSALAGIKTKLVDGTFTESDFEDIKKLAEGYQALNRQREMTNWSITEIKETAGGIEVSFGNYFHALGQLRPSAKEGANKFWNQGVKVVIDKESRSGISTPLKVGDGIWEITKGTAQLAGTILSAELLLYPPRLGLSLVGVGRMPTVPRLVKLPLKGLKRGAGKTLNVASRKLAHRRFYKGRENLLAYDLMHGRVSLEKGTRIAGKLGLKSYAQLGQTIINSGDTKGLWRYLLGPNVTDQQTDLLTKYWKNPHLRDQLLNQTHRGVFRNKWNANKVSFAIHTDKLDLLHTIDVKLASVPDPQSKQVLESLLGRSKNLANAEKITSNREKIFKTLRMNPAEKGLSITPENFFKHRNLTPKELGNLLARVQNVDDVPHIMSFIQQAHTSHKITNPKAFFRKSFRLRHKLQPDPTKHYVRLNGATKLRAGIESLDVGGKFGRVAEMMKRAKDRLTAKRRNPTSPFRAQAQAAIAETDEFFELATRNPEALTEALRLADGSAELAPGVHIGTQTSESVGKIKGMLTKNVKLMKFAKGVLVGAGVILGAVESYGSYSHAQELAQTNPEKANLYMDKALAEAGLTTVGVGLLFVPGVGWVGAAAIAAVEVGAFVAKDIYFDVMDAYTTNKNERLQKGTQAKQEALMGFLGVMFGANDIERSGKESFTRFLSGKSEAEFKSLAEKAGSDALAGWLLMDEVERDPTGVGLVHFLGGDKEDEIIRQLTEDSDKLTWVNAIQTILSNVEKRITYLKNKVGTKEIEVETNLNVVPSGMPGSLITNQIYKNKIVRKEKVLDREGALKTHGEKLGAHTFLRQQLNESRLALHGNENYHDGKENQKRYEQMGGEITKDPRYTELQRMFSTDRENLLYLLYCSHDFLSLYKDIRPDATEQKKATENIDYLQKFVEYISWRTGRDVTTHKFHEGELVYDQTRVKNFLTTLTRESAEPAAIDSGSKEKTTPLTDKEVEKRFTHSPHPLQNILYDIATQVYGMHIENNLDELKVVFTEETAERHGIYFTSDGSIRVTILGAVDGSKISMDPDQQLQQILTLRQKIQSSAYPVATRGSIGSGKGNLLTTQTGSGRKSLNQEIGNTYLRIIDRYYNRLFVNQGNQVVPAYATILFEIDRGASAEKMHNQWFELPAETIQTAMMLGLKDVGSYLYRQREDGQYAVRSKEKGEQLLRDVYPQLK